METQKEYQVLCKRVQQALRVDKEKWIEEEIKEMEEDNKRHKHRNFFRRMRKLANSRVIPLKISMWLGIDMVKSLV